MPLAVTNMATAVTINIIAPMKNCTTLALITDRKPPIHMYKAMGMP